MSPPHPVESHSVVSDSLQSPQIVAHQVPLCMEFLKNWTGVGCLSLLQAIFLTQRLNPHLQHLQTDFFTTELPVVINNCSRQVSWAGEPWGNSGRKECSLQTASTPYHETQGSPGWEKCRILVPDSWGVYQSSDFTEPKLLHLPIHRKPLNSLTWDIWFFFNLQKNCWWLDYVPFVAKTSI